MRRYAWYVVLATTLGAADGSRVAAHSATPTPTPAPRMTKAPIPFNPNIMLPWKMSCQVQIRDANGKVLPDPIFSLSSGLTQAFVFYQVSNDSNLPANDFDVTAGTAVSDVAFIPNFNDYFPANKELLKTLYTQTFPQPNMTLAKMTKSAWTQAGKIGFGSVNTTWAKGKPSTTVSVTAQATVRINPGGINKSCFKTFHVNYANLP